MRFREKAKDSSEARRLGEETIVKLQWTLYTGAMFHDSVLDHFRNPRNVGELSDASAMVEVTNPVCGDVLRLSARLEGGRIAEARFKTQGCVAAIASSSVLTELLRGKLLSEAKNISPEEISQALGGLPPATFHAAQLCRDAVTALVEKVAR
jgi:nitrogen fixation protein NifU and related proteins